MALTISSNISSSIAVRSVQTSDRALTASLSKLSSGSRVQSARDDAASMAIGSRLRAELVALKAVTTNTTQGISMLQIAEGAYARANDMVTRMRALASQAGSANLSNTERGMLDTEFQAIKSELNRMASSTTFGGNQLVNSTFGYQFDTGSYMDPQFTSRILDFTIFDSSMITGTTYNGLDYQDGHLYLLPDNNNSFIIDFTSASFNSGTTTTDKRQTFDIRLNNSTSGKVVGSITIAAGVDVQALSYFFINADPIFTVDNQGYNTQNYRVGSNSGNNVSTNLYGVNATNLGLSAADLTTKGNADAAGLAAKIAIDLIAKARAEVGAAQNRMSSAETNNATAVENLESARSAYLDLDVAAEMAIYTSKQILVQAGISMISQANRKSESLLKLFQ